LENQKKSMFKKIIAVSILFLFLAVVKISAQSSAQQDTIYSFENLDRKSEFKGGYEKMVEFLTHRIYYPKNLKDGEMNGMVYVQFVVEKDGTITNVRILRGLDEPSNKEILRVVNLMPVWIPGQVKGEHVRSYFNLPVHFNR
jgi:TonB family protein